MDPASNQPSRIVVCVQSGLPEYEGRTCTTLWGIGCGSTLHEVIADIVKRNPSMQKYLRLNPDGTATDWHFPLQFIDCDSRYGQ